MIKDKNDRPVQNTNQLKKSSRKCVIVLRCVDNVIRLFHVISSRYELSIYNEGFLII